MKTDLRDDDLLHPAWSAPPGVRALMTTRAGGVSDPPYAARDGGGGLNLGRGSGDDLARVDLNRARLRERLPAAPTWLRQVHGVRVVDASDPSNLDAEADASFTDRVGVVCAVLVADCAPVLFADRRGTRVAAAHAGWRGLAAGVLDRTILASGLAPRDTVAWIGPCIGPSRFEVGAEVRDAFVDRDPAVASAFVPFVAGKWLADLPALAERRLRALGIDDVRASGRCTVLEPDAFYSYRRDGATGRMAALIWIDH